MNTDRLKLVLKSHNSHRGRASFQSLSISASPLIEVQSPLGFATRGLAANLGLATSTAVTDLRQYINSNLGYSDLEISLLYSK